MHGLKRPLGTIWVSIGSEGTYYHYRQAGQTKPISPYSNLSRGRDTYVRINLTLFLEIQEYCYSFIIVLQCSSERNANFVDKKRLSDRFLYWCNVKFFIITYLCSNNVYLLFRRVFRSGEIKTFIMEEPSREPKINLDFISLLNFLLKKKY